MMGTWQLWICLKQKAHRPHHTPEYPFLTKDNSEQKNILLEITFYCKCLLVCLGFFVPFENFSLIWRRHNCQWRAANFYLCLAFMAIEQWGFFSVPHLMWHVASVYNGHLWGPMTHLLQSIWYGAVTTWFYDLGLLQLGFEHPTLCLFGEHSNPLHHCHSYCQRIFTAIIFPKRREWQRMLWAKFGWN